MEPLDNMLLAQFTFGLVSKFAYCYKQYWVFFRVDGGFYNKTL